MNELKDKINFYEDLLKTKKNYEDIISEIKFNKSSVPGFQKALKSHGARPIYIDSKIYERYYSTISLIASIFKFLGFKKYQYTTNKQWGNFKELSYNEKLIDDLLIIFNKRLDEINVEIEKHI